MSREKEREMERRDTSSLEKASSSDEATLGCVIPEDWDDLFWIPSLMRRTTAAQLLLSWRHSGLQKEDALLGPFHSRKSINDPGSKGIFGSSAEYAA